MWLLNTARAELHYFTDPGAVPGGYAILSHTWSGEEQLFPEVQEIGRLCEETNENPRDHVADKIRNCCVVAERGGHAWVWIDSCCINKESSTELSEAINSMFTWYVMAEVCYAYLEDVHKTDDTHARNSQFRKAKWHSRGWTLQELIAPAYIIFLSKEWEPIGTKRELGELLKACTGISVSILTHKTSFFDVSIAQKMTWASKRSTTRVEDEAYCLLGLFDVNMPIIYGEGRRTFYRLQEELLKKKHPDTTLFAWGNRHDDECAELPSEELSEIWSGFHGANYSQVFLLCAASPRDYPSTGSVYFTPDLAAKSALQPYLPCQWNKKNENRAEKSRRATGPFDKIELPSFEVTSYGLKCHLPVAEVDEFTIAVLLVETRKEHLGLILHPTQEDDKLQDPSRKLYYVGWPFKTEDSYYNCRLALLGTDLYNLQFRGKPVNATWRDIYIYHYPDTSDSIDPAHLMLRTYPIYASKHFRVPRCLFAAMVALGLLPDAGRGDDDSSAKEEIWIEFTDTDASEEIRICLGLCSEAGTRAQPCHFAWAEVGHGEWGWNEEWVKKTHDCATDHIDSWPDRTRSFNGAPGDGQRMIHLKFTPAPDAPEQTRVLHLELGGGVYDEMQSGDGLNVSERTRLGLEAATSTKRSSAHTQSSRSRRGSRISSSGDVVTILAASTAVISLASAIISVSLYRAITSSGSR